MVMGTAAQESRMGYYLHQLGGPAVGAYQIEQPTHQDIVGRYLMREENADLRQIVIGMTCRDQPIGSKDELATNLRYATAICRIRYWMEIEPLPPANQLERIGKYWDDHYNANPEHGTVEEFVRNYQEHVIGSR